MKRRLMMGVTILAIAFMLCFALFSFTASMYWFGGAFFLEEIDLSSRANGVWQGTCGLLMAVFFVYMTGGILRYLRRLLQHPQSQLKEQHFPKPQSGTIRLCRLDILSVLDRWLLGISIVVFGGLYITFCIGELSGYIDLYDSTIRGLFAFLFHMGFLCFIGGKMVYLHDLTIDLDYRKYSLRSGYWPIHSVVEGDIDDLEFIVARRTEKTESISDETAFLAIVCIRCRDASWDPFEFYSRPNGADPVPNINLDGKADFLPVVRSYAMEGATLLELPEPSVFEHGIYHCSSHTNIELSQV